MSANTDLDRLPGPPADGSRLYAIVYISTAARLLSEQEIERLGAGAKARNAEHAVTGVLLHSNGAFMQYLEGPAPGLSHVYSFIKTDPLHYGVIDLIREPVQAREFPDWSMAVRDVGALGQSAAAQQYALLSGQPFALPHPPSAARELLLGFWGRGRTSVASTVRDFSIQRVRRVPIRA